MKINKTIAPTLKPGETVAACMARTALESEVSAAMTVCDYSTELQETLDLAELTKQLSRQAQAVNDGNLARAEAMLMSQASSLEAIFNHLARRAMRDPNIDNMERLLRLGLKAQSQCRATLETLAMVKNPTPTTFVKQANISNGHQQINNGAVLEPRAEIESQQTKNLEHQHGERLDTRAAGAAIGIDPQIETVAASNRAKNPRRKG
jgi:hypothetical protein